MGSGLTMLVSGMTRWLVVVNEAHATERRPVHLGRSRSAAGSHRQRYWYKDTLLSQPTHAYAAQRFDCCGMVGFVPLKLFLVVRVRREACTPQSESHQTHGSMLCLIDRYKLSCVAHLDQRHGCLSVEGTRTALNCDRLSKV